MRFWIAYLKDKRTAIFLYLATVALFFLVGALNQMEDMGILLHAAVLSLFLWVVAGFLIGVKYARQCRRLEMVIKCLEESSEAFMDMQWEDDDHWAETTQESGSREGELIRLLHVVNEKQMEERRNREKESADRSDYYSLWTHQIKTPIAAARLLLENGGERDKSGFLLREELFKIEQYVEMALAYQRLESISSDLVLEEYDLYTLLKQAVKKYSVLFINKGLKLELKEQQITVLTDEKWLVFCLEQFLSNSVKYTNAGKITIWAKEQEDGAILFIEDTGIGIRKEDLPRIFERGFTGYNGRMDKRSTGIGLYLCHRVLDHLGISVKVESQAGRGTRVELTLVQPYKNVSL